ncbi:transposase [Bradyrhizobium sp. i1.14.1]|uniref:transposase n=1 Tax=Bradyrhizobium sp. i1.14.1 TaxID=3156360 RepID=UPI003D1E8844
MPKEITFKTKPAIALEQLRWAYAGDLPRGVVLMDAGYGTDTDLRTGITDLGLSYVAGIQPQTSVWPPDTGPRRRRSGRGTSGLRSCFDVMASTDRCQLRSLRLACQRMLGARSRGVKGRQNAYPRALPVCASVRERHDRITGAGA